jgi:hypothetical protein
VSTPIQLLDRVGLNKFLTLPFPKLEKHGFVSVLHLVKELTADKSTVAAIQEARRMARIAKADERNKVFLLGAITELCGNDTARHCIVALLDFMTNCGGYEFSEEDIVAIERILREGFFRPEDHELLDRMNPALDMAIRAAERCL